MKKEKMLIVVPAFNEEKNIFKVIGDIKKHLPCADILVVNDCSTDKTSAAARFAESAKVIDLPCNLGIGGAVQTGFKYAAAQGYDYMAQIDGDGQHLPQELPKLTAAMKETGADMVIGSRFSGVKSYRTTRMRRIGIKILNFLFLVLINTKITDATSGFRLYNQRSIELLSEYYDEDYPEPDAIILLKKHGFKICETGVEMRARESGCSSITFIKSPYYMAKVILSILFSYTRTK